MRLSSRKALRYILVACSVALVGYLSFRVAERAELSRPVEFDAEAWRRSNVSEDGFHRFRMVDDLQRKHLRLGMTRDEVDALLGPAQLYEPERDDVLRYFLRTQMTHDFEVAWEDVLVVAFDSTGRVKSYGVERLE